MKINLLSTRKKIFLSKSYGVRNLLLRLTEYLTSSPYFEFFIFVCFIGMFFSLLINIKTTVQTIEITIPAKELRELMSDHSERNAIIISVPTHCQSQQDE